jgi:hypothetical protein
MVQMSPHLSPVLYSLHWERMHTLHEHDLTLASTPFLETLAHDPPKNRHFFKASRLHRACALCSNSEAFCLVPARALPVPIRIAVWPEKGPKSPNCLRLVPAEAPPAPARQHNCFPSALLCR